jgi:diacylglycerol kinase family enzyme
MLRYLVAIALSRLGKLPDVQHYRISRVRVEGPVGEPVQADGDIVGETPIVIESENKPLMVLAP